MDVVPEFLYKVLSVESWEQSQRGEVLLLPAMDDAFIHLAKEDQVAGVLERFWAGKTSVVLKLDVKQLLGRLVYEANPGRTTKYYHLYEGEIPLSAVVEQNT